MSRTIHHQISAEAADDVAHALDPRFRRGDILDVDGGFSAELARELEPRVLRRPDTDDAPRAHLLRGGDREDADRTGALDHHGIAPTEAAGPGRAIEGADAGSQRLRQRA